MIRLFENKEDYLEYAKSLTEFPPFDLGVPFIYKKIKAMIIPYRFFFKTSKKMTLKAIVNSFAKINELEVPKLEFTADESIPVACLKTKSKTILFQEGILDKGFWYCFTMLSHELAHYVIFSNSELHQKIMKISNEVKDSLKEHNAKNNVVLPEELYANCVMVHLLNGFKEAQEYIDNLFDGFKKEIVSI